MWPILSFFILIGVLVIWHEMGHFFTAKAIGVGVKTVSLGFGKKIWGKQIGQTEYCASLIPLGGYIRLHGEQYVEEEIPVAKEISYREKPAWQRLIIIAAGSLSNFLLGLVIFVSISIFAGESQMKAIIGEVYPNGAAEFSGLKPGDEITSVGGERVKNWNDFTEALQLVRNRKTLVNTIRNGESIAVSVTPEEQTVEDIFGVPQKRYLIGVKSSMEYELVKAPLLQAAWLGVQKTYTTAKTTLLMIVQIFKGKLSTKRISGPLRIAQLTAISADSGIFSFLGFLGMISIGLGIMNLLPIPVLDGGHILLLIYEILTGNPLSKSAFDISAKIGFSLISAIMCLAFYNDLSQFFLF